MFASYFRYSSYGRINLQKLLILLKIKLLRVSNITIFINIKFLYELIDKLFLKGYFIIIKEIIDQLECNIS